MVMQNLDGAVYNDYMINKVIQPLDNFGHSLIEIIPFGFNKTMPDHMAAQQTPTPP